MQPIARPLVCRSNHPRSPHPRAGGSTTMNDMPDAPTLSGPPLGGKDVAELSEQLSQLLRLRTLPIGMKLFHDKAAMEAVPGLRRPAKGKTFSTCQLVTQSRMAGF